MNTLSKLHTTGNLAKSDTDAVSDQLDKVAASSRHLGQERGFRVHKAIATAREALDRGDLDGVRKALALAKAVGEEAQEEAELGGLLSNRRTRRL